MDQEQREQELTARLQHGDFAAMPDFLQTVEHSLLAFIHKRLSPRLATKIEPQDILQEVSISALDAVEKIDFEDKKPFRWLCQLAERRLIDAHRKHFGAEKRSAHKEVRRMSSPTGTQMSFRDVLVASMTSPSEAFSRQSKEARLLEAMRDLPEETRSVLHLRYIEGLNTKEIAERVGKSDGAVRVLLSRSVSKLQQTLGEQ